MGNEIIRFESFNLGKRESEVQTPHRIIINHISRDLFISATAAFVSAVIIVGVVHVCVVVLLVFFFQAEDGIRDLTVTGVQTCALPISIYVDPSGTAWIYLGGGVW